jgi:hypothetical protein
MPAREPFSRRSGLRFLGAVRHFSHSVRGHFPVRAAPNTNFGSPFATSHELISWLQTLLLEGDST